MDAALVFLDILPFGYFLEIEGAPSSVSEAVSALELVRMSPERETYPSLARVWIEENGGGRCTFSAAQRAALGRALGCQIFTQGEAHAD